MSSPSGSSSSYPHPGATPDGGCVIDTRIGADGFGFGRRSIRRQLAVVAAILLTTMITLGYAVEVTAALLAAVLVSVAIDAVMAITSSRPQQGAIVRDAA